MTMLLRMVGLILILSAGAGSELESARSQPISAGGYSFSDELGGFSLIDVSGKGTFTRPFVIVEEIFDTVPVFLVIRRHAVSRDQERLSPITQLGTVYVKKHILNLSKKVWRGFDLELRQEINKSSTYEDGLSFDQMVKRSSDVTADKFAKHTRLFEPRDKIRFTLGYVDPGEQLRLAFPISDTTPVATFCLIQTPVFVFACHTALCSNPNATSLALSR